MIVITVFLSRSSSFVQPTGQLHFEYYSEYPRSRQHNRLYTGEKFVSRLAAWIASRSVQLPLALKSSLVVFTVMVIPGRVAAAAGRTLASANSGTHIISLAGFAILG